MKSKKLLNEIQYSKKLMGINEDLDYEDISGLSKLDSGNLKNDKYFVLHHTAGRGDAKSVVNVLNTRTIDGKKVVLGVQWVIDREGRLFSTLPKGARGAHVRDADMPGAPKDLTNATAQGVEIVGKNDADILPVQCLTALKLVKDLGYSLDRIYGHGEVNSHKARNEGQTCKSFINKYWSSDLDELEEKMKEENLFKDLDKSPADEDKVEKLLDKIGLKKLADMDLDKDGKKFSKEMSDLFGGKKDDKEEKEDEDDEGMFKDVFGISLGDLVKKAKGLFEQRLHEDINKMKKPLK
jgi:hypothetical protein